MDKAITRGNFFFFLATIYFFLCYLLKKRLSFQSNLGENEVTKKGIHGADFLDPSLYYLGYSLWNTGSLSHS